MNSGINDLSLPDKVISSLPMEDDEFREIVIEFVPHLGKKLDEMKQQLSEQKIELLTKNAHWLKGAGGTIGFDVFTQPAYELEKASKERKTEACTKWLGHIVALYERIEIPDAAAI